LIDSGVAAAPRPRRFSTADPRASIADALRYGREYDALGHHIHTILAIVYLFTLPLATAPKDWAFGMLVIWTLIRLPHTWRSYRGFVRMPLLWTTLAWVAWQGVSFLWSDNPAQGWDEFKVQRMLVTPLALWPILDRAPWLVMAALGGVLAQNGMQVAQELRWIDIPASDDGRLRGLIHPIHAGMWFGAAALWHLSATLNVRGWARWMSAALMLISLAGLVATGSRGPWIAAAVSLLAALVVIPLRRPATRRPAAIAALLGAAAVIAIAALGHSIIQARFNDARIEIDRAVQHRMYWSSAGLRIALWDWAWQAWRSSPVTGVGAGDFRHAYEQLDDYQRACAIAREQGLIEEVPGYELARDAGQDVTRLRGHRRGVRAGEAHVEYLTRDHAHSTYLHTLAGQGVIGAALLCAVLLVIARQCWRDRPDHPYSDAMLFVLMCWVVGAQFDCYELNGHQLGLLSFLAALTLPGRPRPRWQWSAIGD
jgi:O-antigen ligase